MTVRISGTVAAFVAMSSCFFAGTAPGAEPYDPVSDALATFADAKVMPIERRVAALEVVKRADADRAAERLAGEAKSTGDEAVHYWCCWTLLAIDKEKHGARVEELVLGRIHHFLHGSHEDCHAEIEAAVAAGNDELAKRLAAGHRLTPRTVELLAECGSAASAEQLRELAVGKAHPNLRAPAIKVLAAIKDKDAVEATMGVMMDALAKGDQYAKRAAAEAIPLLAERNGRADEVARGLAKGLEGDPDERAAETIVRTLGRIDSPISRMEVKALLRTERRRRVLEEALKTAGKLKMKEAADYIVRIAEDDRQPRSIRELALRTLGMTGAVPAAPDLVSFLRSDDARLRAAAHGSLRQITGRNYPPSADVWDTAVVRLEEERQLGSAVDVLSPTEDATASVRPRDLLKASPTGGGAGGALYVLIGVGGAALAGMLLLLRALYLKRQVTSIESGRRKYRRGQFNA